MCLSVILVCAYVRMHVCVCLCMHVCVCMCVQVHDPKTSNNYSYEVKLNTLLAH